MDPVRTTTMLTPAYTPVTGGVYPACSGIFWLGFHGHTVESQGTYPDTACLGHNVLLREKRGMGCKEERKPDDTDGLSTWREKIRGLQAE